MKHNILNFNVWSFFTFLIFYKKLFNFYLLFFYFRNLFYRLVFFFIYIFPVVLLGVSIHTNCYCDRYGNIHVKSMAVGDKLWQISGFVLVIYFVVQKIPIRNWRRSNRKKNPLKFWEFCVLRHFFVITVFISEIV